MTELKEIMDQAVKVMKDREGKYLTFYYCTADT